MRVNIGPRANNGHPACAVTFSVGRYTFKIGAWAYGWENPSYYQRFDHVRFMAAMWKKGAREGERFYRERGFDKTIVLRDNGAWLRSPRVHR